MAKLLLVSDHGEVIDSSDSFTAAEWNQARKSEMGALAMLGDLRAMVEEDDAPETEED